MGTNYYHHPCGEPHCPTCECYRGEHIGKSSAGWVFSFHATDTERTYADWLKRLEAGGRIVDEYGKDVTLDEFKALIERKRTSPHHHAREYPRGSHTDSEGHSFSDGEFS